MSNFDPAATGFTPNELRLNYSAWSELARSRRDTLDPSVREWLGAWGQWDLACSPMDDRERALIRYGHYLGWFSRQD